MSNVTPEIAFQHSEKLDQLATDLSKLQGELPHVGKDSKGYGYNYADLASTLDVLKPLLLKHGFSITQFGSGGSLVTMLLHKSGQFIKGTMELIDIEMKGTNAAQNRGAVLSYFRRYGVQAIVGMASEDNDASSSDRVPTVVRKDTTSTQQKPVQQAAPEASAEAKPAAKRTVAFSKPANKPGAVTVTTPTSSGTNNPDIDL